MESEGLGAAHWLKLALEVASIGIVGAGFTALAFRLVRAMLARTPPGFNATRLEFARYLSLALELQLGADIVGTAVSPTWEQILELASIAVIRTGLNFFLNREMAEEAELVREERSTDGVAAAAAGTAAERRLVG